jgi:hypothetical protein
MHKHPGGDYGDQTYQQVEKEMRTLHDSLVGEKKQAHREQAGACRHDNKNKNDSATDILLLRARAKFVRRRCNDRQPGQEKNA